MATPEQQKRTEYLAKLDSRELEQRLEQGKLPIAEKQAITDILDERQAKAAQYAPQSPEPAAAFVSEEEEDDAVDIDQQSNSTQTTRPSPRPQDALLDPQQRALREQEQQDDFQAAPSQPTVASGARAAAAVGMVVQGASQTAKKTMGVAHKAPQPAPTPVKQPVVQQVDAKTPAPRPTPTPQDSLTITAADMQKPELFAQKIRILLQRAGEGGGLFAKRISETLQEVEEKQREHAKQFGRSISSLNVPNPNNPHPTITNRVNHLYLTTLELMRNPLLRPGLIAIFEKGIEKLDDLEKNPAHRKFRGPDPMPKIG